MSYATGRLSGKGVANIECPICGFVWKTDTMQKRWDGKWVCRKCWEPRHPSDFYRTINDTFPLPFVNLQSIATTYTPSFSNLTQTANVGVITIAGSYQTVSGDPNPTGLTKV